MKSRVELALEIFCIDSYICIKDIFINSMNNPMVEETKLADRENIGDNTVEKEMQCVKILPETKGI